MLLYRFGEQVMVVASSQSTPAYKDAERGALTQPRRDEGDLDLLRHGGVHHRAEDEVGVGVHQVVDDLGRLVHLHKGERLVAS